MTKSSEDGRTAVRLCLILRSFLGSKATMGPTEIARFVGVPVSTTHRMLKSLTSQGFLQKDESGRYRLGPLLLLLAAKVDFSGDLRSVARPEMEELQRQVDETVFLNIAYEGKRLCIDKVESSHSLRYLIRVGEQTPLFAASAPKVLLAHLPPMEQEQVIAQITPLTEQTVTDPTIFREQLAQIRKDGFALSEGEMIEGVSSVAAPVFGNAGGIVACIHVGGPSLRLTRTRLNEIIPLVKNAASNISIQLGYFDSGVHHD